MGSVNKQFHALREELLPLINSWKEEFGFHLVTMQLFPETVTFEIDSFNDLDNLPIKLEDVYSVFLCLNTPNIMVKHKYDFALKNTDVLNVDLGKLNGESLGESWLNGTTQDEQVLKIWQKIGRRFNKITMSGAWIVNTDLGIKK